LDGRRRATSASSIAAIAMHDRYWAPVEPKVRDGGLVLVNDATFETALGDRYRVVRVPASEIAAELGNDLGASMVMVGAFAGLTGLVGIDAAVEGMRQSIPSYRTQHVAANEVALRAGFDRVESMSAPAWEEAVPA